MSTVEQVLADQLQTQLSRECQGHLKAFREVLLKNVGKPLADWPEKDLAKFSTAVNGIGFTAGLVQSVIEKVARLEQGRAVLDGRSEALAQEVARGNEAKKELDAAEAVYLAAKRKHAMAQSAMTTSRNEWLALTNLQKELWFVFDDLEGAAERIASMLSRRMPQINSLAETPPARNPLVRGI